MATPRLTAPPLAGSAHEANGGCPGLSEADRDAVRAQLDRILASPVFRSSKRYCSLLKHVVDRALEGKPEELKERTIGIEVFGRTPDYDTNADHVVRSVAGEVRRRLAQYYTEPGCEAEMRIDLKAGSYVPQFRFPIEKPVSTLAVVPPVEVPAIPALESASSGSAKRSVWRRYFAAMVLGVIAVVIALALGMRLTGPKTAFERFWNPVFSSANPALLCFGGGQATPEPNSTITDFEHMPHRRMHVSDALALAGLAGLLQSNGKPYRILNRAGATSFRDLQSGPFILIGAMNNEWTLRLTNGLRFTFERQPNGARIADKQNPSNTAWSVDFTTPLAQFNRDYAIVSRVRDAKTEQIAVIVAGIGSWGTQAAGEFVTNGLHLKKLEALAPRNWEQKNLQVVISTDLIRGSSGPPNVLAAYFW